MPGNGVCTVIWTSSSPDRRTKSRTVSKIVRRVVVEPENEAAVHRDAARLDAVDGLEVARRAPLLPVVRIDAVESARRPGSRGRSAPGGSRSSASRSSSSSSSAIEMSVSVNQRMPSGAMARSNSLPHFLLTNVLSSASSKNGSRRTASAARISRDDLLDRLLLVARCDADAGGAELAVERTAARRLHGHAVVRPAGQQIEPRHHVVRHRRRRARAGPRSAAAAGRPARPRRRAARRLPRRRGRWRRRARAASSGISDT